MASTRLSLWERIDIPLGMVQALFGTLFAGITRPLRSNVPETLNRDMLLTLTRKVLDRLTAHQLQSVAGTTESNYMKWTATKKITPQSIDIPGHDTKAFWFGQPDADNVVLYFHGGGFAMPGGDGHYVFVSSLVSKAQAAGKSLSVLFLQYDLAPTGQYPRQHTQAVELLRYTITHLGKSPDKLILMGDSAGANMIFGVLSHLMHPHPSIKPLQLLTPLKGAVICSPVTVLNTNGEGFRTQEAQDPASAQTIRTWLKNMLGPNRPDQWNEPLSNEASWWTDLPKVVSEILITVASREMMAADTRACAEKIKSVYDKSTLFASEIDFHAEPTIGASLGMAEGEAARVMCSWTIERC